MSDEQKPREPQGAPPHEGGPGSPGLTPPSPYRANLPDAPLPRKSPLLRAVVVILAAFGVLVAIVGLVGIIGIGILFFTCSHH
jgi:hypothetical protein